MKPICTKPWTRLYTTADGKCWNCCHQIKPFHTVTPNDGVTFEEAWNNEAIQYIRTSLLNGKMPTEYCDCLNKRGSIPPDDVGERKPFTQLETPVCDPRDDFVKRVVGGRSFVDIGGLWGTVNEKVSVASEHGATSLTMIDLTPLGDELWSAFTDHTKGKNVECISEDLMQVKQSYDVVHCSGVIYHHPDLQGCIRHLKKITNKYLILSSVIMPNAVENENGSLHIQDCLHVPDASDQDMLVLKSHWDKIVGDNEAIGITTPSDFHENDYASFWWLPTTDYLRSIAQDCGFVIVDGATYWGGNAYCLLLEICDESQELYQQDLQLIGDFVKASNPDKREETVFCSIEQISAAHDRFFRGKDRIPALGSLTDPLLSISVHGGNHIDEPVDSKHFHWDKDDCGIKNNLIHCYINASAVECDIAPHSIGWITEPREIIPQVYDAIKLVEKKFKYIFVHDDELLARDASKYKVFPLAGHRCASHPLPTEKSKNCSFVCSTKDFTTSQKCRLEIVKLIRDKSLPVDIYGFDKWIRSKNKGLDDYRFSIAVENSIQEHYFTEKITDCFATYTIPVYFGATRINDYFNQDGIIQLSEIEDLGFESLTEDLYKERLGAVIDNRERVKKWHTCTYAIFEMYYDLLISWVRTLSVS